jgi:group II intron reverse transcriptase/maturase
MMPTIKDRTVQTLLKMLMEPIWEADFLPFSNGFRPTRCTMDCIAPIPTLCNSRIQYRWVIEGDIRACFDRIPHEKLITEVARRIADRKILTLIRRLLASGLMERGKFAPTEEGTPQGGIVSPLLANIYLHRFDEWYTRHYAAPDAKTQSSAYQKWLALRKKGGAKAATQMYRYADDWIVLVRGTKQQAQAIKEECKIFLGEEMGLELSEEKTTITHIEDGFDFLGYHISRNNRPSDGRSVGMYIRPTEKGLKRTKLKIKQMTDSTTLNDDYLAKIQAINALVRGWASYYRAVNPSRTFADLDAYVWLRLRIWFAKKHQISPKQVRRRFMRRQNGPKGGHMEFVAQDAEGKRVWRYRATQTRLIEYRPTFKKSWPNPYLEKVKSEPFVFPRPETHWTGYNEAPTYQAQRRIVLQRAQGSCERCGKETKLTVHHKHRVKRGRRKLEQADNRPEMLEAICWDCQVKEHRAENIHRNKMRAKKCVQTGQE